MTDSYTSFGLPYRGQIKVMDLLMEIEATRQHTDGWRIVGVHTAYRDGETFVLGVYRRTYCAALMFACRDMVARRRGRMAS